MSTAADSSTIARTAQAAATREYNGLLTDSKTHAGFGNWQQLALLTGSTFSCNLFNAQLHTPVREQRA